MDKKYCAYLCSGCSIGDALDMDGLSEVVTGEMAMDCKTSGCLCSPEGRALIEKDIADDGVNTVVIGACSPRVMHNEFDFGDDKIVVRANLREQVVWTAQRPAEGEEPHAEAAAFLQETAADYLRMACARAKKTDLTTPFQLENLSRKILVMGGGIAGLTAAKEASAAGYEVTLVEKTDQLGGKAASWRKAFPTKAPWTDLEDNPVEPLIAAVNADAKITVKTGTEVARIAGSPGAFRVSMKPAGTKTDWDAPRKVTSDEREKIEKGEMEDPNGGLHKYMAEDPAARCMDPLFWLPVGSRPMSLSMSTSVMGSSKTWLPMPSLKNWPRKARYPPMSLLSKAREELTMIRTSRTATPSPPWWR